MREIFLCEGVPHTATHCNTQQHTAIHCYTLQPTATHCNTQQYTATHCNTLQHIAFSLLSLTHTNTYTHTHTHTYTQTHTHTNLMMSLWVMVLRQHPSVLPRRTMPQGVLAYMPTYSPVPICVCVDSMHIHMCIWMYKFT